MHAVLLRMQSCHKQSRCTCAPALPPYVHAGWRFACLTPPLSARACAPASPQHLLDCDLLKCHEEVEELAAAAVKEEQIEKKLEVLQGDWALQDLAFAEYKTRGPVILKVGAGPGRGTAGRSTWHAMA